MKYVQKEQVEYNIEQYVYHKNIQSLIFYQINVNVKNSYTRIFFGIEYTVGPKINILKYCKPVQRQAENGTATAALLLLHTRTSYALFLKIHILNSVQKTVRGCSLKKLAKNLYIPI